MSNSPFPHNNKQPDKVEPLILLIVGGICGLLAGTGLFSTILSLGAVFFLFEAIQAFARVSKEEVAFERYKKLILAALCMLFSHGSGILGLLFLYFLISGIISLKNSPKPKTAPRFTTSKTSKSTRTSRQPSFQSKDNIEKGVYVNKEQAAFKQPSFTSSTSGQPAIPKSNPFEDINQQDIIRQAKAFMSGVRTTAQSSTQSAQPSNAYQKALDSLLSDIQELESREELVSSFLDDFFAGSTVSKTRYTQTLKNARSRLETNYQKARQAVQLFGNSEPTPERLEIINRYVEDSSMILDKVEKVINELITVQQNDIISDGQVLDELLDDLAETTTYYQRSPKQTSAGAEALDEGGFQGLQMPD